MQREHTKKCNAQLHTSNNLRIYEHATASQKNIAPSRVNSAFKQLMSLHWVMASSYLVLFVTGSFMARLPRELLFRNSLYDFHKSIAVLTMALLTLRIFILLRVWWNKYTKRPQSSANNG